MPDPIPNTSDAPIATDTLAPVNPLTIRSREAHSQLMGVAGASPESIAIDELAEKATIAGEALAEHSLPGETLYQTAERLQADGRRENEAGWLAAQAAISAQRSLEAEQGSALVSSQRRDENPGGDGINNHKREAEQHRRDAFLGEGGAIRAMRTRGLTETEAFAEVTARIELLGIEHVLPTYSRIQKQDALKLSTNAPGVRYTNSGRVIK